MANDSSRQAPLFKWQNYFTLALANFSLLCCVDMPGYASPITPASPASGSLPPAPLLPDDSALTLEVLDQGQENVSKIALPEQSVDLSAIDSSLGDLNLQPAAWPQPDDLDPNLQPLTPRVATAAPTLNSDDYLTTATALTLTSGSNGAEGTEVTPAILGPNVLAQTDSDDDPLLPDPELGVIQVRSLVEDTDLGILRIREQPEIPLQTEQPRPKIGFLTARLAIANSDNILLAVNDVGGLIGDTFLRPSLAFAVYPSLGPQTVFIGTADLGLQRYVSQSSLNYDDLRFRVGLRQGLTPRSYGQLVLTYQELFRPGGNRRRFFKNTAIGLTLGRRDPITPKLTLDSYYFIQFNGAQSSTETASGPIVTDFSRLFQSAGGYLGYDITPRLQAGISYQLNLVDYTSQDRYDGFQQVLGQMVYRISPALRLSVYSGVSFGRSSEPRVQFNDTFFGAAIDATLPLF